MKKKIPLSKNVASSADAWYVQSGEANDVVLSTRTRLSRNLANFLFPHTQKKDEDAERIMSIVFDAFSQEDSDGVFHCVRNDALDEKAKRIFFERGIFDEEGQTGLALKNDESVSCRINNIDHVRIASFEAGLNCQKTFSLCKKVDAMLQKHIQFAASYDFGYLTSFLKDAGSGMKISIRVHLPSLEFYGETENEFKKIRDNGFAIFATYGAGDDYGSSLGSYYDISTTSSFYGSEFDQIASLQSLGIHLVERERKFRAKCADNRTTRMNDTILRAFASCRFNLFLSLRESIKLISVLKWGYDAGLLSGVSDPSLTSLLYRVQKSFLETLVLTDAFHFEKDIENNMDAKIDRLRSLLVLEVFKELHLSL